MSSSTEIETTVVVDFMARLTASGVANQREGQVTDSPTYPVVSVGVMNIADSILAGVGVTGFKRVDVMLDAMSYRADDHTGASVRALAKTVRDSIMVDDIITQLNTLSTYNYYYDLVFGQEGGDVEDGIRHIEIPITVQMRPSNSKTTTTTTTTTTA